jgi:uncharacterized protein (TIGR02147 family)
LVQFKNEKKAARKEAFLQELLALRTTSPELKLENMKLRFFEKWYYPVIRELVCLTDYGDDYHSLANAVLPRISPDQAEGAVKYLLENGFLKKNAQGKYEQFEQVLTTGPEVNSTIVRKYHKQTLIQCAKALETVEQDDRDITSLTLGVSRKTFDRIKDEFKAMRKRLLALAREDEHATQVCLVSFQVVPRSKPQGEAKA